IPAGEYPIGDNDSTYDNEKPAHIMPLDAYEIGQFPVTNAEYALFIKAGGYKDEQWWDTEAAKVWLRGEGSVEGQIQLWMDTWRELQVGPENDLRDGARLAPDGSEHYLWIRPLSEVEFRAMVEKQIKPGQKFHEPEYWNDANLNNPT